MNNIFKQADGTEVAGLWVRYDWKINKFAQLPQRNREFITSSLFHGGPNREQWFLRLYPRGDETKQGDLVHVAVSLHLRSSDKLPITVKTVFEIWINRRSDERNMCGQFEYKDIKLASESVSYEYKTLGRLGCSSLISRSKFSESFIFNFTLRCHIRIISPLVGESSVCEPLGVKTWVDTPLRAQLAVDQPSKDEHKTQLSEDLRLLFKESKFSDVTIIVGSEKFRAHKSVLTVRSPVFAAMFEHEQMTENIKNEVKIEDMEPVVVKALLEFLYTGEVNDLESLATGLLAAANKYELVGLKGMCKGILHKIIDEENAIEILTLAHLYEIDDLKRVAMDFVKRNFVGVSKTDGYKEMNNCELMKELMCYLVTQESGTSK